MRAKCLRDFRDLDAGVLRKEGDVFEVTPERFDSLNSTKYGELVREVRARKPKEAKEEE